MTSIFNEFFNKDKEKRNAAEISYQNDQPKNQDIIKIIAKIYGRVQGVGFRFTTVQLAKDMGVKGIVRNENDGSVYVEALADPETMDKFILELAKGPSPSANVEEVVIKYDSTIEDYTSFKNL